MFESARSRSSSSEKLAGDSPPPALKAKSWASSGTALSTSATWPRLRLVKVQVTCSPAASPMLATALPSSQLAPVWSQPAGSACDSE